MFSQLFTSRRLFRKYRMLETINIVVAALTSCGVISLVTDANKEYVLIKVAT